jgi:hypothetical protein
VDDKSHDLVEQTKPTVTGLLLDELHEDPAAQAKQRDRSNEDEEPDHDRHLTEASRPLILGTPPPIWNR